MNSRNFELDAVVKCPRLGTMSVGFDMFHCEEQIDEW